MAALLGHGIAAYAELVKMAVDHDLSKGSTMSDWIRRPLTDEQIKYAEDDVRYLEKAYDYLTTELDKLNRLDWFFQECIKHDHENFYTISLDDTFRRLKKVKSLTPLQAAKAYQLLQWREKAAQQRNRPPPMIMRNDSLVEVSKFKDVDSLGKLVEEGSRLVLIHTYICTKYTHAYTYIHTRMHIHI